LSDVWMPRQGQAGQEFRGPGFGSGRYDHLVEPSTLGLVGTAVLTEGVKFLFAQAGEAIRWWRERKDDAQAEPVLVPANAPLHGRLEPAVLDHDAMKRLEGKIGELRAALAPYADPLTPAPVDPDNPDLIAVVEGLRRSLEAVLGQRIRFQGEPGDPSGPVVMGEVDVDQVFSYVAGVSARSIRGGQVRGTVHVKTVEAGGRVVGVDADTIGGA
jgi:hypothetical protein